MAKQKTPVLPLTPIELVEFERFWTAYPRRTGKGKARAAFKAAIAEASIETMLKTLKWLVQSEQWLEGFIPLPATWLNQERWDDEPPPPSLNKKNARALVAIFGHDPEF